MDYKDVPSDYYCYMYLRKDGTPYYVGKGIRDRVYWHGSNHRPPKDRSRILIFTRASEQEAFETEKLICNRGRKDLGTGILRNLTDGGDGASGAKYAPRSEETRRLSEARKGKPNPHGGTVRCRSSSQDGDTR